MAIVMKRSSGVTNVCGQFDSLANSNRHLPVSATRSSHWARRCGSNANAFTVLMPTIVSPNVAAFQVSAPDDPAVHLPHRLQISEDDDRDYPGAQQDDPRQRRIEPEQE